MLSSKNRGGTMCPAPVFMLSRLIRRFTSGVQYGKMVGKEIFTLKKNGSTTVQQIFHMDDADREGGL